MPQLEEKSRPPQTGDLPPSVIWLMAGSVGAVAANIYYAQPLLGDIARTFGITVTGAGALAMLTQAGTALGQFSFVPLGDILERRRLMTILVSCAAAALAIITVAPNLLWLSIGSFLLGLTAASVHVIIPFAAHLAPEESRGSGVRPGLQWTALGNPVGTDIFRNSWCDVRVASCIRHRLRHDASLRAADSFPPSQESADIHAHVAQVDPLHRAHVGRAPHVARRLLHQHADVFHLLRILDHTRLLPGIAAYHYGSRVAGLFGLVGAAGALGAPLVGHFADRYGARRNVLASLFLNIVAWIVMWFWGTRLAGLIIGVLLMDVAAQAAHVSNQTRMYALRPTPEAG